MLYSFPSLLQIVLSVAEHHSNTVPWHLLAKRTGAVLKHVTLTPDEQLDMEVNKVSGNCSSTRTGAWNQVLSAGT